MALINVKNADGSVSQVDDSQVSIQPVQKAGAVRSLGDTLLKFGRGAAGATKAGLDAFGANNALSHGAGKVADFLQSGLSDEAMADDMISAQRSKAAEGKGPMAELGATLRNFAANPIDTFAEGAGSIVPTAAAMIASRGRVNPSAVGVGLGAAQGAGAVKGSIYDAVKQDATVKGYNEAQADQLATDAQAYNGQNRDQIALGAGLGVVAGKVGAESTRLLTGQARQPATSLLRDTLKGVAVEGGTEAAQGGQERFAANTALNRLGADVDPMAGVVGQAAAEGIAGGLTGGAFNAVDTITSRREQFKQTLLEQGGGGAISQAAATAVDTGAAQPALGLPNYAGEPMVTFPDGTTMTQAEARARYTQQEIDAFNARVGNNQPTQIAGALPNKDIDPMIVFADGSTGKKSDFDNYINNLPTEADRMAARAKFMGYAPQPADAPLPALEELPENTGAMLPSKDLDPMVVYPDGSTGKRSEFDAYINNLPEQQRVTEMARLLGYGQQGGESDTQQPVTEVAAQDGQKELANAQTGAGNELSATGPGAGLGSSAATPSPSMRSDIPSGAQPRTGADTGNAAASADVEQGAAVNNSLTTAEQSSVVGAGNSTSNPSTETKNNDIAANDAATSVFNELPEPSPAQKDAGNYKLGRIKVGGLDVSIENPDKSTRKGTDPDGTPWETITNGHYGYIKGVVARSPDKQHVDVNVKPGTGADFAGDVFIVNQNDPRTGKFDEPKVYMGYADEADAEGTYRSNYMPDWKGFSSIVRVPFERFKQMLNDEQAFMQPVRPTLRQQIENRKSITKEETESLFGLPVKREKALKRIAEGRGWFGNEAKAKEFVRVNGLSDTHKAVKGKGLRWDILENKQDSAFHVLSVNNATGAVTRMTSTPVTESEGNTIISKNTEREGRTLKLEPVKQGGAVDISSAMANAVSVDNLSNDQLEQVASILGVGKPKRPQPGQEGYTLEMAKEDLGALIDEQRSNGLVGDARLDERIMRMQELVNQLADEQSQPENDAITKAKADLDSALSDLGDIFGKNFRASVTPEQEQKLIPVLTRLFDAAFRLGYQEFKQAAKFVLDTIRANIGNDVADAVNIDQLQGSYIAMAGKYGNKATSKRDVISVESKSDIDSMQTSNGYVKTNQSENSEVTENARPTETRAVPRATPQNDLFTEQPRDSNSKPVATRVAAASEEAAGNESVRGSVQEPSRNGAQGAIGNDRDGASSTAREAGNVGNKPSTTGSVDNFEITDDVGLGEGGLTRKFKDNLDAIKLIKALESEGRQATPEERIKLAKYAGFGALKGVFDKANKQWSKQYQELKDLLTDQEYESARASVLNAHYTSKEIVYSIYSGIERLGFKGGRVLEPSLGSGNFFGLMPSSMRNKSQLSGVELDFLTSRLAKQLYPKASIAVATGFQDYAAPSGYFDAIIGNPPFGSERIFDNQKSPYSGFSIHNYFLAKSIDKLRDGGVLAVVVSHNFMDVNASPARDYIAKHANLIGAIRLPDTAFQQNAGTEVVTDIVFFQKTDTPEKNPAWVNSTEIELTNTKTGEVAKAFVNDYFLANPRMVLGRQSAAGTMYRGNNYTVEQTGDVAKLLKEAIQSLPENIYVEPTQRIEVLDSADNTVPDGVKVGTYFTDESGVIRQRLTDLLGQKRSQAWEAPNNGAIDRMKGMMKLRDVLRDQMRLERSPDADTKQIEKNRQQLNKLYDDFQKKYGYLNSVTNRRIFLDDTESALLQALEMDYDQGVSKVKASSTGMEERPASATKADIFKQRVLFPPSETISVSNAKDALLASLNEKGRVDMDFISDVYGKSIEEALKELGDVVFEDPQSGYVMADEYLSDDVKTKLNEAKAAAKDDSKFKRNVEALEKVIPKDKLPSEIYVSVGANFVPADVYAEFASEITGAPADKVNFTYVKATANWLSANNGTGDAGKLSADFGTEKVNSFDLFAMMLNGKSPEIKYTARLPDGRTETRTDVEGTEAARAKYQKIKETWESWLFSDPSRAERIAGIYNDKHNRIVPRKFDGSHMTFPGMNPAIKLRPSQKNVVWRGIQDRNVLLDHVVGAGKTMAMATIAMEMKRLGISRKPLFVVPNHLTLQWRSEFTRLYPASNILAATPEDFSKDKRERLFSKMVTGSYDAIIIGHSSLKKVGLPPEVEEKLYNDQINEIANAIEQMKRERGDRSIIRDMEKIKTTLENKVKDLVSKAGKKDDVVNFDEIGIDSLFVDEMHEFKNLFFTTQMQRVSGLGNPKGSGKAFDMFMKVRWMGETFGDNAALITATGTPVSNSLSEMFTMQRYHKYDQMKRDDLHLFDAWSKQYGEVENLYEVAPSGVGYRQSTRFSKFKNLPSLMGSYTSFADIVTLQDLKDNATAEGKTFPVPKLRSGKPINVVAERSELQTNFFGVPQLATDDAGNIQFELEPEDVAIQPVEDKWQMFNKKNSVLFGDKYATKEDAELDLVTKALTPKTFLDHKSLLGKFANLRQLTKETKGKVNALSLTGLANKCGLDYRLIDAAAPDYKGSKINKAVDNMLEDYKLWSKDKGTQIIFCDMSIPLSARNDMGRKEKRVYVRDRDDSITHKPKGVIYAPEGFEGFPFYLVKERDGFDIYEPVSGQQITTRRFSDKAEAKAYINSMVESDSFADRIYGMRDRMSMEQAEIDEYRESKELEVSDDFSNEITMADLEAVSGSAQFSVYDDIRAKLIDRGVPETEIAFIHDFNTPKQKEDLFKRVNRGDVRFLFGSTPKLGAGTNVQQRLVALHHIDAPWRPSDLEQREGRIIRQGNKLYERDPEGFEVAVYRYATEQTYDTRRWQLLEHKASGIEQLRKYTGESEIEDVSSEAANSADMKAAASGNPLILEETQLRTEKKRLENLQRAFNDSKFAMQQRITSNKKSAEVTLPQRIAHYAEMKRVSDQYPVPEDKEAVAVFNIDGRNITSKEKAEESLSAMAARVRQAYNEREEKTFTYRGIEFTMSRGWDLGMLELSSQDSNIATYLSKDGISPSGMITRLNNYISSFNDRIARFENEAQKAKNEADQLASRLNDPFEQAGELESVRQKHVEIQRKLMKSTQLDAIPKSQLGEFKRIVESRKADLRNLGFSDAVRESERDAPSFSRTQRTNLATQSELEEVAKLIAGLESDKPLRKSIAERKVQMHPMSDAIKQVSTDFYDIIEQLEDAGLIKINC